MKVESRDWIIRYCSRIAQTATDFADASHSKSAKSVTTTVSYGIFSSENAYPCTVTLKLLLIAIAMYELDEFTGSNGYCSQRIFCDHSADSGLLLDQGV